MTAKSLATIIGVIFIIVGILGFIDNPIVGKSENAIFRTDMLHNIVHIVSGVLFVCFAMFAAASVVRSFMILFGLIYLALGVIGAMQIGHAEMKLFGFLHVNKMDNYLHIVLGVVIMLAGFVSRRSVAVA